MESRYDMAIGGEVVGEYVVYEDDASIRQHMVFTTFDGTPFEQTYEVRHDGTRATGWRTGDDEWVDLVDRPDLHLPTIAYPLIIRAAISDYLAVDLDPPERRTLEYLDGKVIERTADRITRSFRVVGGRITAIDWGGATSTLLD